MIRAHAPGSPFLSTADVHFLLACPDMSDAVACLSSIPPQTTGDFRAAYQTDGPKESESSIQSGVT